MGLLQTHLYMAPHSPAIVLHVQNYLEEHVIPVQNQTDQLRVNGRDLRFKFCAEDTVWFNFEQLCKTNRSQNDFLELARLFNTLILTDIQVMDSHSDDVARRFVLLIDVLYDHHVILIASAATTPEHLYQGKRLVFEFKRTASRLIEMQSQQYPGKLHTVQ